MPRVKLSVEFDAAPGEVYSKPQQLVYILRDHLAKETRPYYYLELEGKVRL